MSEKTNYNTQKISTQDAALCFGGISKDKAVISSFEIRARDGRHIFKLDRSGKRKNWTTSISPGNFQVKAGLDNKAGTTIYVEAENGDGETSREWLRKASLADPDPAWVCENCGNAVADWELVCGRCQNFDSLIWQSPPRVTRMESKKNSQNLGQKSTQT